MGWERAGWTSVSACGFSTWSSQNRDPRIAGLLTGLLRTQRASVPRSLGGIYRAFRDLAYKAQIISYTTFYQSS